MMLRQLRQPLCRALCNLRGVQGYHNDTVNIIGTTPDRNSPEFKVGGKLKPINIDNWVV